MAYDWKRHKSSADGDENSRFVKFVTKGDRAVGEIIDINETNFGGARPDAVPNLCLGQPDGSVREVGLAQVNLLRQVADAEPGIGDHIEIEYLGEGPKSPGKNPPKLFKVTVTPKALTAAGNGAAKQSVTADDSDPF